MGKLFCLLTWTGRIAVGIPFDGDDMGVMEEAVHCGAGQELIAEKWWPLLDGSIGRYDQGTSFIA